MDYLGKKASEVISANLDFEFVFKDQDGKDIAIGNVHSDYTVISQDIAPGAPAYKGMTVILTVKQLTN